MTPDHDDPDPLAASRGIALSLLLGGGIWLCGWVMVWGIWG